jgi:surfactin synthase thioesterase subunit
MRADFCLFDEYEHEHAQAPPIDAPIHTFFAVRDRKINEDHVKGWQQLVTPEHRAEFSVGFYASLGT